MLLNYIMTEVAENRRFRNNNKVTLFQQIKYEAKTKIRNFHEPKRKYYFITAGLF